MYRTIGKILAVVIVLAIALMIILLIATSKEGDKTVQNTGVTTTR